MRSAQRGATLIELMIGITILALLIMVGLPAYRVWLQNLQIRNAAESVLNGMQLARNEAVRRNVNVQLVLGTQSSWNVCLYNTVTSPCILPAIQSRDYSAGSKNVTVAAMPANATIITFNSLGRVVANGNGTPTITQLDFDVPTTILSAAESRNLRIVVAAGGNVRMCDPTVTDTSDVRYC